MAVRLLAIPASHPCAAVEAMLRAKGVAYERVDLFPAFSRAWLRMCGFQGATVPALRIDGIRVQGSRAIARALEASWPDPPLFPADPAERARVEEIEAWADGPLQAVARHIALWSLLRSRDGVRAALGDARLQFGCPARLAAAVAWPILRADAAINGASSAVVRADIAALPRMLERADEWIARGDLAGPTPTAADFQVAGCVRLMLTFEDLAEELERRPVAELARRLIAVFPGRVPAGVLPPAWLP